MNNIELFLPFKPFYITQKWGNPNPAYAAQFNNPDFQLHNGTDANVGQAYSSSYYNKYQVYCPVKGFRVHKVQFYPQGGGNEIWLISKEKVKMFDLECYAYLVLCHADKVLVPAGYEPELGELIMIADNTGFSTGVHTHIGLYRVDFDGKNITFLDKNKANGSFSPELFFTKEYAVDMSSFPTAVKSAFRYYNYLLGL